jgi:acetoin utilization deacetylase AcuC-like enzyme
MTTIGFNEEHLRAEQTPMSPKGYLEVRHNLLPIEMSDSIIDSNDGVITVDDGADERRESNAAGEGCRSLPPPALLPRSNPTRTESSCILDEHYKRHDGAAHQSSIDDDDDDDDGRKACEIICQNNSSIVEEEVDIRDSAPSNATDFDIAACSVDVVLSSDSLLRMDQTTMGDMVVGGDDHVVDDDADARISRREGSSTSRDRLQVIPDGNEGKDDKNGGPSPPSSTRQSVRFATTNRMRQYYPDREVLSLLQENESYVEQQTHDGKRKQIIPRRLKNFRHKRLIPTTADEVNSRRCAQTIRTIDEVGSSGRGLLLCTEGLSPNPPSTDDLFVTKTGRNLSVPHQCTKKNATQVILLHSHSHTQILHEAMQYIHQDRDILLESLLKWCGILRGARGGGALSSFFKVLPPKMGTRSLLENFHHSEFLDLLEFPPKQDNACQSSTSLPGETDIIHSSGIAVNEDESMFHEDDDARDESLRLRLSPPHLTESCVQLPSEEILSKYGLEDDCPYPTTPQARALLWKYCLATAGASWHAASLLTANGQADVAIHWGGGRHHAHASKASGFCYVSDVILAIQRLLHGNDGQIDAGMLHGAGTEMSCGAIGTSIQRYIPSRRVLYIDIDIHHADAVQAAFYATDRVLTASFHRHSPGFFPATSGSANEKGEVGTSGFGYNLNVPLPAGIDDVQFIHLYREALFGLVKSYDPHVVVLCVGADGLEGDALISGRLGDDSATGEGWTLSPEGLAESVRIAAAFCAGFNEVDISPPIDKTQEEHNIPSSERLDGSDNDHDQHAKPGKPNCGKRRKLLILGGGGYVS